jgi:MYND finger
MYHSGVVPLKVEQIDDRTKVMVLMNELLGNYDIVKNTSIDIAIKTTHKQVRKTYENFTSMSKQSLKSMEKSIVSSLRKEYNIDWTQRGVHFDDDCLLLAVLRFVLYQEMIKVVQYKPPQCGFCQKDGEKFKVCGKCKNIRYCSIDCQKKDWKVHKDHCVKIIPY